MRTIPLLEITNLQVHVNRKQLFRDVNLVVEAGQFLTLMGENGVGKTTLLETLLGFHRPTSGTIRFFGKLLNAAHATDLYTRIAFVPSHPERYPAGTTLGDLLQALEMAYPKWRRDVANALAEGFKLDAKQPLNALSLGESTKIRLIKALPFQPDLLLLDELTANLSPDSKKVVTDVLLDVFSRNKMGIVYVCHSHEEAVRLSDRVALLTPSGISERSQ